MPDLTENPFCADDLDAPGIRNDLYLTATRAKIHVHGMFDLPCNTCLLDVFAVGRYGFAMLNKISELEDKIKELEGESLQMRGELEFWSNR